MQFRQQLTISNVPYYLEILDLQTYSPQILEEEQGALFVLLSEREKEFGFNPNIITEYPDLDSFLSAPIAYIADRYSSIQKEKGSVIDNVIILTTYGDKLIKELVSDGYLAEKIHMPAGPDHTYKFRKDFSAHTTEIPLTLYLEAVNENDEKIKPTFMLKLMNMDGTLAA